MKRAMLVGLIGLAITVLVTLVGVWASIGFEPWNAIAEDAARVSSTAGAHSAILPTYGDPLALMRGDALKIAFIVCPLASIAGGLFCGAMAPRKPLVALSIALVPVFVTALFTAPPVLFMVAALVLCGGVGAAATIGVHRARFRPR
jgi:hypothetical protein